MRRLHLLALILPTLASAAGLHIFPRREAGTASVIAKREEACSDLRVNSNNGGRKVALVIDSSGSMSSNDPARRRIDAGRSLADFLISSGEAGGGKTADQLTVIDFDDVAKVVFPLGDPANANASLAKIDASGGTNIANGVNKAYDLLTASDTGATDKRSAIVVFTDGSDGSQTALVNAIRKATAAGIRVSFGFLDLGAGQQSKDILKAVRDSRGVYATITAAAGSINFINYVLLNGLTYQDNPQGYDSQLLAGLSQTYTIGGSTVTLKYQAVAGEVISFRVVSISAGALTSVAQMGGSTISQPGASSSIVSVTAPNSGQIELQVSPRPGGAPQDSLFSVTTNSNVPLKNCTVGVGSVDEGGGLSTGAKAGIGIGATVAVLGLLGGGGYFAFKHFHIGGAEGGIGSAPAGDGGFSSNMGANGGNITNVAPGFEKVVPISDVMPVPPDGGNGLAPSAPGQGGFGPNAGGLGGDGGLGPAGGGGQTPLNLPPHMSPPPPGGGPPGVFVPVFIPPMLPPGSPAPKDSSDHNRAISPPLAGSPLPRGVGPSQWQIQGAPPFNGLQQNIVAGPGGLQQTLGNSTPLELGGGHGGMNMPPGQGDVNLPGSQGGFSQPPGAAIMPNHTGSTFVPSSGDIGSFPPSHGDLGPGSYGAPYPGHPGGPGAGVPTGPPGGSPVYLPGSSFGIPGQNWRQQKHHHHHWLPLHAPCEDRDCILHSSSHVCHQGCHCACQDPNCPLNR